MIGVIKKGLNFALAGAIIFALASDLVPANSAAAQKDSRPAFANTPIEAFMGGGLTAGFPRGRKPHPTWSKPAKSAKDTKATAPVPKKEEAAQINGDAPNAAKPDKTGTTDAKTSDDSPGTANNKPTERKGAGATPGNLLTQAADIAAKGEYETALEVYNTVLKSAMSSGDAKLAAPAFAGAARMLHQLGKNKEALDHLDKSISVNLAIRNARARSLDYLLAGRIHLAQSDWDNALKAFEEAQKILPASDSAEIPRLLEDISACQLRLNRPTDAVSTLNRLLSVYAKEGKNSEVARVHVRIGETYVSRSDYQAARASFKKAEKLYRDLGSNRDLGETLFSIAYLDQMLGDLKAATQAVEEGQALLGDDGKEGRNALPLLVKGLADHKDGKTIQALNKLTAALTAYESAGDQIMAARVRLALTDVELDRGRFTSALELGGKALEQFRSLSSVGGEAAALHLIADVYFRQGFVQKALAYAQDSLAAFRKTGDRSQMALVRVLLAEMLSSTGDNEAASKVLKEAVEDVKAGGADRRSRAFVRLALARYRFSRDASERALQEAGEARKEFIEINDRRGAADTDHLIGLIYEVRGESEKAISHLQRALEEHQAMADRFGEGRDLTALGVHFKNVGENDKAQEYFSKALDLRNGIGDRRGYAANLANIGNLLRHRNRISEGVQNLEQALAVYRQLSDKKGEADILTNLGIVEAATGSLATAFEKFSAAIKIHREIQDTRGVVADLTSMGRLCLARGDLENALKYLEEAETANKRIHNPRGEVSVLTELAMVQSAKRRTKEATALLNRALDIAHTLGDSRAAASIHLKIAGVLEDSGEHAKALSLLSETLEEVRQQGDRQAELWTISSIAVIQTKTEDFENALASLNEALKLRSELGMSPSQSRDLDFYLGEIYEGFRDLERALEHYHKALAASQAQGKQGSLSRIQDRIGNIYYRMEDYAKAKDFLEEALRLHVEVGDVSMQKMELVRLGDVLSKLGDAEGALKYQQRALALTRQTGDPRGEARILTRIGTLHQILGRPRAALEDYEEAKAIRDRLGDRRGVNENLLQIALVNSILGDSETAVSDLKRALEIAQRSEDRSMLWKAYFIMGRTLEGQKSLGEALEAYRRALSILEAMEADIVEESEEDNFIFGGKTALFETTLRVLMLLAKKDPQGAYDAQALRIAEKLKAAEFESALERINVEKFSDVPEELQVKEKSLRLSLRRLNSRLTEEISRANADQKQIQKLLQERRNREQAFVKLREQLTKEYPNYADLRYPKPIDVHQLQRDIIQPDEALIVYMVSRSRTYLFAIDKQRFHTFSISYAGADMQRDVEAIMRPLHRADAQTNWDPSVAYRLYSQVIKPIEYFLIGKKDVVIIPHGPLALLPFEILVNSEQHAKKRFWSATDRPRYLVENYAFCYAPSTSVLAHVRMRKREKQPGWSLVAFGDALYGDPDKTRELNPGADKLLAFFSGGAKHARGPELRPLPGARREIAEIVKLMNGPSQVYTGPQATETLFKKADLSRYRFVHLATHGVLLSRPGKRRQPSILFSLYGDRENDGFLQLGEVFGLKLNADLVFLSSCLSAGKPDSDESDGLMALSRAFLFAGTDSLILGMWQVNDESTAKLCVEMYRNLKEGSKAEALRHAKLTLLKNPPTSHPYYWAPFILVGDWRIAFQSPSRSVDPHGMGFKGISTWRKLLRM